VSVLFVLRKEEATSVLREWGQDTGASGQIRNDRKIAVSINFENS
jgi:hypothetical protein